jgi:hypothetical protein
LRTCTKRENETEQQYLLRLANRYFVLYQHWPVPSESATFGPVPAGFERAEMAAGAAAIVPRISHFS